MAPSKYLLNPTGMILDGVAASQAIDSSGEVLDVEGCDVSSLPVDGTINYEHQSGDDGKAAPGEETVGKILVAHKVFTKDDCENDRERLYWDKVRVPFIYIVYRLFDRAGHRGAKALAAAVRDAVANNEAILIRLSIEGSTLKRDGHVLLESVARRVSATWKPCNRTCSVGLLADPDAPEGFEKEHEAGREDPLDSLVEKAEPLHPHPLYTRLGGACEVEVGPDTSPIIDAKLVKSLKLLIKAKVALALKKAYEAGSYSGAPSTLSGGAAMQREATPLRDRLRRCAEDYQPKGAKFDKAEFKAFAKAYLPEVDDSFLDHYADVAEGAHTRLKKREAGEDEAPQTGLDSPDTVKPQEGVKFAPRPEPKKPPKASASKPSKTWLKPKEPHEAPPAPGRPVTAVEPKTSGSYGIDDAGRISIPGQGEADFHVPDDKLYGGILRPGSQPDGPAVYRIENEDTGEVTEKKIHESLHELYRSTVHAPWERAMDQWVHLNKAMQAGKLPTSLMRMAVLMAAMSPNTSVPAQEHHFGHVMDMIHEGRLDISKPFQEHHFQELWERSQGHEHPQFLREHYARVGPQPGVKSAEEAAARALEMNAWGNPKQPPPHVQAMQGVESYARHLEHLIAKHGADGRAIADELMNTKAAYERRRTQVKAGPARQEFDDAGMTSVEGYGPKLLRYALGMMGAGNMIVPDRHMARSFYNFDSHDPRSKYVAETLVRKAMNEPFLRSMDQHFYNKHPAVDYVINHSKYREYFKEHPDQAVFPAFWLHWLHLPHYERNQGRATKALNGGTDHMPYFVGAQPILDAHGIPVAGFDRHHHHLGEDTSFDFGANVEKSEGSSWDHVPVAARGLGVMGSTAMQHGDVPAFLTFFTHVVPAIMDAEDPTHFNELLHRFEALSVDLRKAVSTETQGAEGPKAVLYAGRHVQPGSAYHAGGEFALLGENATHYTAVPAEKLEDWDVQDLVRLPKDQNGTHYRVARQPAVALSDLR